MATEEDVRACLGEDFATYAARKYRGGKSGAKGTRYEDLYMACLVLDEACALLDEPEGEGPHVRGQVFGFVDDVRVSAADYTKYFQLKNQAALTWDGGEHPLEGDFKAQVQLCCHLKEPVPLTTLVVSDQDLATRLAENVPASIQQHTAVEHFPWYETANRLVFELPELRGKLARLAQVEDPSHDVLTAVLCALVMACVETPEGATVAELIARARSLSFGQIRLLPTEENWERYLLPQFVEALARIPGLAYGAKRGYLYWSYLGMSGVFTIDVRSDEFQRFEETIVREQPKTFDDFEKFLP